MLPRTKSIFHIGDENEEAIRELQEEEEALIPIEGSDKKPVGLRVIIENSVPGISIITKCMINGFKPKKLGFLKTCFFCHKELSSQMDVFIYKGEQTFCSFECRDQKILTNTKRELETYMMRRRGELYRNYTTQPNVRGINRQNIITLVS